MSDRAKFKRKQFHRHLVERRKRIIRRKKETKVSTMASEEKTFKVLYRLKTKGVISNWHELEMNYEIGTLSSFKEIKGPDLLTAHHFRSREISLAIKPMLSEATTLESLVITEVEEEQEEQEEQEERNTKGKGWRIHIREQSDHYWLVETFPTEAAAMAERKKIKEGILGGGYMVQIYDPNGKQITKK